MGRLRNRIVDGPNSLGARTRARRSAWFIETFPDLDQMSVIDLGGTVETWLRMPVQPKHVHVVNLEEQTGELLARRGAYPSWTEVDYGDACALPEEIRTRHYDLAFSNSVIEHVGGHERRLRFAETVRGIADQYWVQTPYRFFPVEPHFIAPGAQHLPTALRAQIVKRWPLVHSKVESHKRALETAMWTELVDRTQMRYYFPDGVIRSERLLGLTKSLIAVRTSG